MWVEAQWDSCDGGASNGKRNSDRPTNRAIQVHAAGGELHPVGGADAIGGVIQVFTRKGAQGIKADAFVGYGTQNTFQSNVGVSGGGENWRFRVAGNYESTDGISAVRNAQNKDEDRDQYRNKGGSASFSFLPAKGHELGASVRQNEAQNQVGEDGGKIQVVAGAAGDDDRPCQCHKQTAATLRLFQLTRGAKE